MDLRDLSSKFRPVETTAMLAVMTPPMAIVDTLSGLSSAESIAARLANTGVSYLGGGLCYVLGRNMIQRASGNPLIADMLIGAGSELIFNGSCYLVAGVGVERAVLGALTTSIIGAAGGVVKGYAIDTARDLVGIESCERRFYPTTIRNQPSRRKRGLAAALVAASMVATAGVYQLALPEEVATTFINK